MSNEEVAIFVINSFLSIKASLNLIATAAVFYIVRSCWSVFSWVRKPRA